jgi:transcriptional regulator with XRE-family HTH domain
MKKKNAPGPLIKRQRDAFRLTQRELARKLGVKASHVAYIENGLRRPSLSLVRRLAETLGLDKQQLLLMTYPEARFLIAKPRAPVDPKGQDAWRQFSSNRALLSKYSVTPAELKILQQVSSLGRIAEPRNLLFVLNAIRQSVAED